MKKIPGFLLFFVLSFKLFAQTAKLEWGEFARSKFQPLFFIGYNSKDQLIYLGDETSGGSWRPNILTYDKKLEFVEERDIEISSIKIDGKEYNKLNDFKRLAPIYLKENVWIVGAADQGDNFKIYAWKIDKESQKVGKGKHIGTIRGVNNLREDFVWSVSPDERLGMLSIDGEARITQPEKIYALVLDSALQVKSENLFKLKYKDGDFHHEGIAVDNQGRVILSGNVDIPIKERTDKLLRRRPVVIMSDGKSNFEEIRLKSDKKRVQSLQTRFNDSGNGAAVGFYGNDNYSEQDGLFYASINANGELQEPVLYEFTNEYLTSTMKEKRREKEKERLKKTGQDASDHNFYMREVNLLPDGSFLALAEYYMEVMEQDDPMGGISPDESPVGGGESRIKYIFGDIMVARFGADGKVMWVKKINRNRSANTTYVRSKTRYSRVINEKGVQVFYQDYAKDEGSSKYVNMLAVIDLNGNIKEEVLERASKWSDIQFENARQLTENEILLVRNSGLVGSKKSIGRLRLK